MAHSILTPSHAITFLILCLFCSFAIAYTGFNFSLAITPTLSDVHCHFILTIGAATYSLWLPLLWTLLLMTDYDLAMGYSINLWLNTSPFLLANASIESFAILFGGLLLSVSSFYIRAIITYISDVCAWQSIYSLRPFPPWTLLLHSWIITTILCPIPGCWLPYD